MGDTQCLHIMGKCCYLLILRASLLVPCLMLLMMHQTHLDPGE